MNWALVLQFGAVALLAAFIFFTLLSLLWLGYWMWWRR